MYVIPRTFLDVQHLTDVDSLDFAAMHAYLFEKLVVDARPLYFMLG
jgi:hypothetical protein